jgi:nucleotide-binding universal stress UspA family protein
MRPIHNLLVPIDFSEHSQEALLYAGDLAQRYGARLTLAHVVPVVNYAAADGFMLFTPEQLTTLKTQLEQQLAEAANVARGAGASEVELVLLQGDPFTELNAYATRENSDLIVIGTHGRAGWRHALLGSVAEKLVRSSSCPVLTVRKSD